MKPLEADLDEKVLRREHLTAFVVTEVGETEVSADLHAWHVDAERRRELDALRLGPTALARTSMEQRAHRDLAFRGQWDVEEMFAGRKVAALCRGAVVQRAEHVAAPAYLRGVIGLMSS